MLIVKKAPFVVTLVADLRPLVVGLNRELLVRGAEPVRREELMEIDRMLYDGLPDRDSPFARCRRCGGYVCADTVGDYTCLNCGRPVNARGPLEDVIQEIAQHLIERRREWSQVPT
jgi:tRNA(Ile2) C34 agmatinyltransferase TiaS